MLGGEETSSWRVRPFISIRPCGHNLKEEKMNYVRTLLTFGVIVAGTLSGCVGGKYTPGGSVVSNIEPAVRNAIAYCSGGIESETQVKIEAAVVKNGGKLTGGLADSIKGIFASRPGMSSADAVKSEALYMECLDKRAAAVKTSDSGQCTARLACEIAELQGACTCRSVVFDLAKQKGHSNAMRDSLLSERCYPGNGIKKCWESENISLERAKCESALSNAGVALPKPSPGTCLAGKA